MKIIKTKVIGDTITPIEQGYVIENQVNQYAIEFDFDETWNFEEKYCIFQDEFEEQTFKRAIINNQVIVPSELLNGRITIQVYGQNIENDVITNRQPSLKYVFSILNSLPTNASEEQDVPTPTQWELYIEQIEEMCNDLQDQFNDLKEDCETKCDDVIERLEQDEQNIQTNTDNIRTNAEAIDKLNTDLLDYSLITETGNKLSMSINPQTYVITLSLKDKNDNVLSTQSVDLPLETMIVSASYSDGVLTFTLKNGQTLQVPISDLIDGLVSTDTFNQAIQGLSNRITTIENDYLKASDKTELQNQITANADDISDIKEEQLTQNADIESLQQENERLSRIVSGLPTKNASGTNIVLNDMVNCEIKEISLKGDTLQDGTPTPSSPVEVQSVKGNQTIQCCGKNLFNPALYVNNKYQNYSSTNMSIANNNDWWITGLQEIKPNETYTKSNGIAGGVWYDENRNPIIHIPGSYQTITAPSNAKYICMSISKTNLEFNGDIQLELGNNATPFEKYNGTNYQISLGNIELNKIGDYQDKIYKQNDKWYLEKNTKKMILTTALGEWAAFNKSFVVNSNDIPQTEDALCSAFVNNGQYWSSTAENLRGKFTIENSLHQFKCTPLEDMSLEDFTNWLDTTQPTLYCGIPTPVITEITDDNLINQLEALNNYILLTNNTIISNGDLPVINDITGYVDIMSLLSTQNNRNVVEEKRIVTTPIEEPVEEPIETKEEER